MKLENIKYIHLEDLHPHPNNPRKDLGDLTELAESIKQNGIMQNLTVIPYLDEPKGRKEQWTVVIGHRRLEAAKLAALDVVPCIVTEMDEKKQIATMLLENIQRNNLTVLEQAKGMQMMMDLGDSVADISKKTGFGETTIRHRIKIMELDQKQVEKCEARQPTISDYIKLEEIKDITLRNEALKHVATPNFNNKFQSILSKDKWLIAKEKIIEELKSFAIEITKEEKEHYKYRKSIHQWNYGMWKKPDDAEDASYYFALENDWIYLYEDVVETNQEDDEYIEDPKVKEREMQIARAKELSSRSYNLRKEFVLNHKYSDKDLKTITEMYIKTTFEYDIENINPNEWIEYLGLNIETGECEYEELIDNVTAEIKEDMEAKPLKYLTIIILINIDGKQQDYIWTYPDIRHEPNEGLDATYNFLLMLGYEMSEEEKQLQDGTHEIFNKTESEDEE